MPVSRDYTKEVGIPDHKKKLSRPVAFAVLALVAVVLSFGVAGIVSETRKHHAAEKAAKPSLTPPAKMAEPAK